MADLVATPNLRGGRIDLRASVVTSERDVPKLVLVRRRWAFPEHAHDGLVLLDTSDLLDDAGTFWGRIERRRFVATNSPRDGGLEILVVSEYFAHDDDDVPSRLIVVGPEPERKREHLEGTTEVVRTQSPEGQVVQRFSNARGEQGVLGWLETPDGSGHVTWIGRARAFEAVPFHAMLADTFEIRRAASGEHRLLMRRSGIRAAILEARIADTRDPDRGEWMHRIEVADRMPADIASGVDDLEPGTYYHRLFGEGMAYDDPARAEAWRTVCIATGRHGFAVDRRRAPRNQHRLYQLLPAVLRRMDEPNPSAGSGQLRSFSEIVGSGFDTLRSSAELLRHRHDIREAAAHLLPRLASYVGWPLDHTRDAITQRHDIGAATRVYRSVGTAQNIEALINRATGREVLVKEFIHNVAFTNAIEPIRIWDIFEMRGHRDPESGRIVWDEERHRVNTEEGVRARPAGVSTPRGPVLAWHALEGHAWGIHTRDGRSGPRVSPPKTGAGAFAGEVDPALVRAPGSDDDVLLFSSVQRSSARSDLLVRRFGPDLPSTRWLTDHPACDRFPAAVNSEDRIWLFWQSDRAGTPGIWMAELSAGDPEAWTVEPRRLSDLDVRDEMPAAAIDPSDHRITLVWSRGEGDRSSLWWRVFEGGAWGEEARIDHGSSTGGRFRDRSPAIASFSTGGLVRTLLVWQSDRPDEAGVRRPRLWQSEHDGTSWSDPTIIADSATADDEPALFVEPDGTLRLLWSTRERGKRVWSRTIDTTDTELLTHMGHYRDRAHYTYDTRREDPHHADGIVHGSRGAGTVRHAGDVVGLFFPASDEDAPTVRREIERMRAFVEPFRPAHIRLVWHMPRRIDTEEVIHGAHDEHHEMHLAWIHTTLDGNPRDGTTVDTLAPDLRHRIMNTNLYHGLRSMNDETR